jgi:ABC-type multidrug transport system ATPase subunit
MVGPRAPARLYGEAVALRVDFPVEAGSMLRLLGSYDAGRTTAIRIPAPRVPDSRSLFGTHGTSADEGEEPLADHESLWLALVAYHSHCGQVV